MDKTNKRLQQLFKMYADKSATENEIDEFWDYVNDPIHAEDIKQMISDLYEYPHDGKGINVLQKESIFQNIFQSRNEKVITERYSTKLWPRIAAAASIILCLGIGGYFYFHKSPDAQQTAQNQKQDIVPGGNKAVLTLANGKRITLTDAKNGMLAKQAGITITKTANGLVVYSIENTNHSSAATNEYNFIETPKGGQYKVQLPDGTSVWLNAASSLKYPASFAALKERKVELNGEAYFEVAKDKAHPFIVNSGKQDVKVLGTHFDINSYRDEPGTKTTLLEGSIQLNNNTILKPGEQADLGPNGDIAVNEVDASKFIAWKNGKFVFDDENIQSVMRKLARWYNVEVVYDGNVSDRTFTGSISRFDNISKILDKITYTQTVHFKIEGRRITVIR